MDLPADLLHLFEHLRAGRARRSASAWAQAGRLDTWLPPVGGRDALDSRQRRSRWLQALDDWHFRQGPLSPALMLASRLWDLGPASHAVDAFPCLARRPDLVDWIDAVRLAQMTLDARHADPWRRWTPLLRLEALRLLRWRELSGERPVGEAARCWAAMHAASPPATVAPDAAGSGAPRHLLSGAQALAAPLEEMLLGWGVAQVREPADTALACLVAALRFRGHLLRFTDLQAEWPWPNAGLTLAGWQRVCRRVGLTVTEASHQTPIPPGRHALCQLRDGRCVLLLGGDRAYAPSAPHPFRQLQPGARRADDVGFVATLDGPGSAAWLLRRPVRRLRLQTLQRLDYRGALADPGALRDLQADASRWPDVQTEPPPLQGLSLPALMAAHRHLGPPGSPFHGQFRQVDLHSSTEFLHWPQIPAAMDELIHRLAAPAEARDSLGAVRALAPLFMDFLRIHPFLNGNRRVAMALAGAWAAREGWQLDGAGLSRLQLHHAVRCAAAGHPGLLVQALAGCLHARAVA